MRVRISLDDDGLLAIESPKATPGQTVRLPVAETLITLFEALEADLALSRDGAVSLQFDAAPNAAIAELVAHNAAHVQPLDALVAETLAEIEAEADADDVKDLSILRDRLQTALMMVDAALTARRERS